jgi:L-ascorbate metabolism protein UlaG (beta-lactamase superfamily)
VFVPVGGGPTIGADAAAAIVRDLAPAHAVPMHYRTPAIGFLEPADAFVAPVPAERPPATRVVVLQPPVP